MLRQILLLRAGLRTQFLRQGARGRTRGYATEPMTREDYFERRHMPSWWYRIHVDNRLTIWTIAIGLCFFIPGIRRHKIATNEPWPNPWNDYQETVEKLTQEWYELKWDNEVSEDEKQKRFQEMKKIEDEAYDKYVDAMVKGQQYLRWQRFHGFMQ